MKIKVVVGLLCLVFCSSVFAQKAKETAPKFDVADFNKKFEVAEWLVEYDVVAWKTSDEVMKQDKAELEKLGAEWFCFQDKSNLWHAVYGKFENEKFETVFHFTFDKAEKITKSNEKVAAEFLNLHAKSLVTANKQMRSALKSDNVPRFNQYIKQNADQTFSVWIFPAFQPSGIAAYGGEFIYTIDKTGTKILKDESYLQGSFRGFKASPPREIWLNYSELEKPTLGAIFFVWYYKSYFTNIFIDNAKTTSTVVKAENNNYTWVHVEKTDDKKNK